MKILMSACLLGIPCRYDGKGVPCPGAQALAAPYDLVPICPEQLGGLPTPRPPAEIRDGRVFTKDGQDVTAAFAQGAEMALAIARLCGCTHAVLKAKSPSCGCGRVYDGQFTGTLTGGDGVTAALLRAHGIAICDETQLEMLLTQSHTT